MKNIFKKAVSSAAAAALILSASVLPVPAGAEADGEINVLNPENSEFTILTSEGSYDGAEALDENIITTATTKEYNGVPIFDIDGNEGDDYIILMTLEINDKVPMKRFKWNYEYGTKYAASKLNGELSESSNKSRLFSMLSGKDKNALTMAQAARWLLYVNAFDDTSAKPSSLSRKRKIKYGSPGAGWLGKLGLITLKGENLFETLMLNTALWTGYEETAAEQLPSWEKDRYIPKEDDVCIERTERVKTAQPDNLAALYTLRSRCILLERNEDGITGYSLLGGEFFDRENAFIEPMTVWRDSGNKKQDIYTPKRHDRSKQFWREFASVYPQTDAFHRRPGIISWFAFLKAEGFIPSRYMLNTKICSVQYGDKDFFITDVFSDSLSMSGDIILGMALPWQKCIEQAVELTEQIADIVGRLAREIFIAEGGDTESAPEIIKKAKSEYYFDIDNKFRKWLAEIDPSSEKPAEGKHAWEDIAVRTAKSLGRKIVNKAGTDAIIGRTVIVNDRPVRYSAAKAENNFYRKMGNIKQREV